MTAAFVGLFGFKPSTSSLTRRAGQTQTGAEAQAEAARQNRLATFEAMVGHDWDRFWRYAYRLCGNADDAEDLLSDSLLEAFQSFDKFRGEGFDKWLFRILTTNRIDMARRAKVRRAESLNQTWDGDDDSTYERALPDTTNSPERVLVEPLLSEDVQNAMDKLGDDFRAALLLCDVEQMDYQEIAQVLNVPIGTVRSRIHRARAQMRASLEKSGRTK